MYVKKEKPYYNKHERVNMVQRKQEINRKMELEKV